jgi:hypothetical protein
MWFLVLILWPSLLMAQSGSGAIQGSVKDQTGAALPGTNIHVLNKDTGQTSDTKSNDVGFYSVPSLFPGNYIVTFSAEGMQRYEVSVRLQVAQTAVISPLMSAGSVTQQVTVTGDTIQLATYDSGTISSQLDNKRINQLPMNGRNILTLTGITTPGLEAGGTRANGNLAAGIEYVQDGAPLSDRNFGGPATQPDPDSVQEVKIETTNSNAKFATPATAIVTTKSGTNQFHGSIFETARNNAIGVAKARQDPYNLVAPHLVRNEFGASIGGPILIPKLYNGKNRSFFFFAYERFSNRQFTNQRVNVPTQAMRNGNFSGLVNSNGVYQQLYDGITTNPSTYQRQPFVNNQIPMSRLSPLAKTLYDVTPLPMTSDNPFASNASNFTMPAINNQTRPTITFRLDHTVNEANRLYLRYTSSNSSQTTPRTLNNAYQAVTLAGAGLPAGATNLSFTSFVVYSAGLGYTHIFSPTFVSETVIGNEWENGYYGAGGTPDANFESQLGLPNNYGQPGFPQIGTNLVTNYYGTQFNYGSSQILTNIDENLTKTINRHQLFFGGRYRHERIGALPDRTQDTVSFNGMATALYDTRSGAGYSALANTGNVNADFFLGAASSYSVVLNSPYQHWHNQEFDAYFQDDFHANDKLTINAGLRWEAHPAATERNNALVNFDFNNKAIVLGKPISEYIALGYTSQAIITNLTNLGVKFETPRAAGLPDNLIQSYNWTFSPRIGFAYSPMGTGKGPVFRGGFGRYIYPIPLRNFYASAKFNAPFAGNYAQSYIAANQSPDGLPSYLLRASQTVVAGVNSSGVVSTNQTNSIIPGGPSEFVLNPRYPPNFVTQLNATVEQPLKGSSVLGISYLWNHGSNLDQQNNRNQAMSSYAWRVKNGTIPPTGTYAATALNVYDDKTYGGIISQDRNGWSNDNALQVNYQRLYQKGYAYQVFWVYSRAMRVGGNAFRDSNIYPYESYAPGTAPTSDPQELNRFENYQIDSAIPLHRIGFNGLVDLPFGRGKMFFGHANRFVDELIGGYQIAGAGSIVSQYFQVGAANWGTTSPIRMLKKKYRVTDCSSGTCRPGYQWFNGFVSPLLTNNPCGPNLISGVPSGVTPYQSPINVDPGSITCKNGTASAGNPNFLTNNVNVRLADGSSPIIAYLPGPNVTGSGGANLYSKTWLLGPYNWSADLSLFKVFPITETMNVRINVDAFNAFNVQGYTNPNATTGIQNFLTSYNTPRQLQFTARFTF